AGDSVNYSALASPITVTIGTDVVNVESLTGPGGANDTLVGDNIANTWSITGATAGTLNGTISYTGFGGLTGGSGNDTFSFADGVATAGGIDGGLGTDTLDWSAYTTARSPNILAVGTSDGYFGTEISVGGGVVYFFDNIDAFIGSAAAGGESISFAGLAGPVTVIIGTNVTNFETITGSASGNDTLQGDNVVDAWSITGADAGTLHGGGITFSSFENLTGGTNDDTFTFQVGGSLSGLIDGGAHVVGDTVDYSALAGPLTITFGVDVTNIETLNLPVAANTVVGDNTVNVWVIDGADTGTLNGTRFNNTANLVGGNTTDTFTFINTGGGSLTGSINGGAGASDTIVGDDLGNIFTVTGADVGTLTDTLLVPKTTGWSAVENLTGGAVDDTFAFGAVGSLSGQIDGRGEVIADTVDYSAVAAPVVAVLGATGATNIEKLIGDGVNDTLVGSGNINDWNITQIAGGDGVNEGTVRIDVGGPGQYDFTFDGFLNLTGGGSTDTFTFDNSGSLTGTLDGAGGGDTVVGDDNGNAFGITGSNSGTLTGKTSGWINVEILSGGAAADTFTFGNAGALTGSVTGGGGSDTIIGDNDGNAFGITGADAGTLTSKTSGWSGIENLTGGAGDDTFTFGNAGILSGPIDGAGDGALGDMIVGDNGGNTFVVTGVNSGTLTGKTSGWTNIENLTGGNGTDTFTFANAGSLTGAVDGGLGNDELIGDNTGLTFTITGADSGTLAGKTSGWTNIQDLTGGTGDDTFTFGAAGSLSGLIDGGAETTWDTLDYSLVVAPVTVIPGTGFTNIERLIGDGVNDTLEGTNVANTWNITGVNSGTLNGTIAFQGFANLTGGTNVDTFNFANAGSLTGALDGNAGNDTIAGDDDGNAFSITGVGLGTLAGKTTGWSNVENLTGGADDDTFTFTVAGSLTGAVDGGGDGALGDTLIGDNDGNAFSISGADTGTLAGKMSTWTDIENLTGGNLDDTFTFGGGGSLSGLIDGGAHAVGDEVDYSPVIAPVVAVLGTDLVNIERVIGDGANDTFQGNNIANTWIIDGVNTGTLGGTIRFVDMPNLTGGTNTDSFTFTNAGRLDGAIDGNGGIDTIVGDDDGNAFSLTGADSGTLTGKTATGFSSIENLTGGLVGDTFAIGSGATLSGNVDGGLGADTLTQADGANTWTITGANAGTVTDISGTFTSIESLTGGTGNDGFTINSGATLAGNIDGGSGGTDTLAQVDGANTWTVTGVNTGTVTDLGGTFSNIDNLTGGTGNDDFTINSGATLSGNIDGATGANTLTQVDGVNAWLITGADTGTVTDVGGTFSNIQDLTGGAGADTFTFGSGATLSGNIDGGGGSDTLAQADGANTWTVTGGNTGTVTDLGGTFSNMENLTGGTGNDDFTINSGATLTGDIDGGLGNDTLIQTDGNNAWTINGADTGGVSDLGGTFSNMENLTGGTGDDTFTFGAVGSLSGLIDGNTHGAGDTVDYSAVVAPVTMTPGTDFINVEFVIGDGTSDTLAGQNVPNTWNITGVNSGTLTFAGPTTITFTNMPNLRGGTATDDFIFANAGSLTGAINGDFGTDTIVGDDDGNAFSVTGAASGTLAGKMTGFTNIENLTGGLGDDTFTFANAGSLTGAIDGAGGLNDLLIGDDDGNTFTIDNPDTGTLAGKTSGWSNIETLTGGAGDDTFTFGATGALTGIIDGAGHAAGDTVDYSAVTVAVVTVVDTDFTNVEFVVGDGANDTLVGSDIVNAWFIDGGNTGTLNGTLRFTNMPNLTGGTNTDTFTFANAGSLTGAIDGAAGDDTLVGDDDGNVFTVTGLDSGTLAGKTTGWSNVENLTGGAGDDGFTLNGGTLSGTIDGAGGSNTLTGDNVANTWVVTATDGGTVTGVGIGFSNIQNLMGGTNTDQITLNDGGTITGSIDGGVGNDSVEVHGDPVAADLIVVEANGARLRVRRTNLTLFTLDIGTTETLIVSAGGGNDNVTVSDLTGVADLTQVTLNGEAGDDRITVNPSPTAAILVDGGPDSDTIVYVGPGVPPPAPGYPNGVWTQAGFQDVTVVNCEWAGTANKIATLAAGQVIIYDTDAPNPLDADVVTSDIIISLDRTGAVVAVTLVGNPTGFGIIIDSIGPKPVIIRDARSPARVGPRNDLSFIACMGDVFMVNLYSGISGYDAGTVLAGEGLVADPDLDGDGSTADPTALYADGYLGTVQLTGDVGGDVIAVGTDPLGRAMRMVKIKGQLTAEINGQGDLYQIMLIGGANNGAVTTTGNVTVLLSAGNVTNSTIDVPGNLKLLKVVGVTDQSTITVGGATTVAVLRGGMTNSTLDALGGLTRFRGGDMAGSTVNGAGNMRTFFCRNIAGSAINILGDVLGKFMVNGDINGVTTIDITGSAAQIQIAGAVDQATATVGGAIGKVQVRNGMSNTTLNANGGLGSFFGGDMTGSTLNIVGDMTMFLNGNVTGSAINIAGGVGKFMLNGGIDGVSVVDVTGDIPLVRVVGALDQATFTVGGVTRQVQLYGGMTNSTLNANTGIAMLYVAGMTGSAVNVTGDVTKNFIVNGPIDGASTIDVTGNTYVFKSMGGILGNSTVNLAGNVKAAYLLGGSLESSLAPGSTFTIGGDLGARLETRGKLLGTIDVVGSAVGTSMRLNGSITLGGRLLAGAFGNVTVVGSLLGAIGDAGTAPGVGNTLVVTSPDGDGTVTPADAFAFYFGYTP
ncbi:MAG: hypothetical protein GXP25_00630, partial [Planctomycetes bacterium]|nr:hypothetical protein [Planctomycetota bacterium]